MLKRARQASWQKMSPKDWKEIFSIVLLAVAFVFLPRVYVSALEQYHSFQSIFFFLAGNLLGVKKSMITLVIYLLIASILPQALLDHANLLRAFDRQQGIGISVLLGLIPSLLCISYLSQKTEEYKFFNIWIFNMLGTIILIFTAMLASWVFDAALDPTYLVVFLIFNGTLGAGLSTYLHKHYEIGNQFPK